MNIQFLMIEILDMDKYYLVKLEDFETWINYYNS